MRATSREFQAAMLIPGPILLYGARGAFQNSSASFFSRVPVNRRRGANKSRQMGGLWRRIIVRPTVL